MKPQPHLLLSICFFPIQSNPHRPVPRGLRLPSTHPSGAKLLFGGKPLRNHSIPEVYGAVEPTAVFVPLEQALLPEHFETVTTEVFGPFQVRPAARQAL